MINSFKEARIDALKNSLIKNDPRIRIEKVSSKYMDAVISLAIEVFTNEQNIPEDLIPLREELKPIWWCARVGEDIIGIAAAWRENDEWHWGRYAVDKRLRSMGIGMKMALYSLNETFNLGTEEIFSEARDITVKMLEKFGCEIIGEPINFYGDSVTPICIKKYDFIKAANIMCE